MRTPLVLVALLAIGGGIGGTGHAAPMRPLPQSAYMPGAYLELSNNWDAARRAAFARLVLAAEAFARAAGAQESDGADATAEQIEKEAFLRTLRAVVRGQAAADDGGDRDALEPSLNATYSRVMAVRDPAELGWGRVDKAGIRRTERAWLAYRDAFVAFAATFEMPDAAARLTAELTRRRTASLEALLED